MTRTVHSKVENILVVAAQGKGMPRTQKNFFLAESRRSIGQSEISFQINDDSLFNMYKYGLQITNSLLYLLPFPPNPPASSQRRRHAPTVNLVFPLMNLSFFHQSSYIQPNWNKESKIMYKSPWSSPVPQALAFPLIYLLIKLNKSRKKGVRNRFVAFGKFAGPILGGGGGEFFLKPKQEEAW